MLLLQSGPGAAPGEILTSPFDYHLWLGFALLFVWLVTIAVPREKKTEEERKKINNILLAIWVINSLCFTGFIYYAFLYKDIVGYELDEQWGWLDSLYTYKAIYSGETAGLLFLYLFPIVAAKTALFFMPVRARANFMSTFLARYPVLIFASYIIFFLLFAFLPVDLNRLEIAAGEP